MAKIVPGDICIARVRVIKVDGQRCLVRSIQSADDDMEVLAEDLTLLMRPNSPAQPVYSAPASSKGDSAK